MHIKTGDKFFKPIFSYTLFLPKKFYNLDTRKSAKDVLTDMNASKRSWRST
jgi:hypothetical protein